MDSASVAKVNTLDSLRIKLDSAEQKFLQLDSTAAVAALDTVNAKLGKLGRLIVDTLEKAEAFLISDYRAIKKPLKEFLLKSGGTKKEIGITRKQLQDLAHDLTKGIIKKEEAEINFKKESALAEMLINSITMTTEVVPIFLKRFELLNPRIDSLVQVKEQPALPIKSK